MELNKKNMKNIMLLIVFAVLLYICVQKKLTQGMTVGGLKG